LAEHKVIKIGIYFSILNATQDILCSFYRCYFNSPGIVESEYSPKTCKLDISQTQVTHENVTIDLNL
jgi:hypothetical protein